MFGLSLITIILIVVVAFIFFKITKVIWQTILFTLLAILIILGITGYLVYQDVQEVINGENAIIVIDENNVQTGAILYNTEDITYFNSNDLITYSNYLDQDDYDSALGEKTLLIILNTSMFEELDNSISIDGRDFSTQDGLEMILSSSTIDFLEEIKEKAGINESILSEEEMIKYKLQITLVLVEQLIIEEGTESLMENTKFYPERLTIKLIRQVPELINMMIPNQDEIN